MKRHAPLLLLLALLAGGCASRYADAYRRLHPDWEPGPPSAGTELTRAVALLHAGGRDGASVALQEIRLLRVDRDPWQKVPLPAPDEGSGAAGRGSRHALLAFRSCSDREGLTRHQGAASSWFLFQDGRAVGFDYTGFGRRCESERAFLPGPPPWAETERDLKRFAARQHPEALPNERERMEMGLAYARAGRLTEAEETLEFSRLRLAELRRKRVEPGLSDDEREALTAREGELQHLRRQLRDALREARGEEKDPSDSFWEGEGD